MPLSDLPQPGWAPPNVNVPLPTLSPPFLSPDDAARFAHELIGDHRDVQYGGAILKNKREQYFATRPVRGTPSLFRPERVMSTNPLGRFRHPPGYTCVAFYHSHADLYEQVHALYEDWPSEDIFKRVNFFSPADIYDMLRMSSFAAVSYLSGLNGSLIKYECSGSDEEKKIAELLAKAKDHSHEAIDSLIKAVHILISLGTVSVIQSNELWGKKVGPLDETFKFEPGVNSLDIAPVIVQRPAFGPIVASEALALDYARTRIDRTEEEHFGVILKHAQRNEFVVSEPVTEQMDFSLSRVFVRSADNKPALLAGYELFALYGCDGEHRDPTLIPAEQASLFKNFMHPQSLEKAIGVAQLLGNPSQHSALPLYIAARDGAILKYVSRYSADEKTLFAELSEDEGGGMELVRNLLADVEKTLAYIQLLAHAGELSVVRTSEIWSRAGRVQTDWQPFQGFMRRTLSPSFVSADDAARYAHEQIAGRVDAVYGGLIFQGVDNRFFATQPLAVHTGVFDPQRVIPPELLSFTPYGGAVVAVYQTHRLEPLRLWRSPVEEQLNRSMFYPHELCTAIKERDWAASRYLSTHDGVLLKYTPSGSALETALMTLISPPREHPEQVRKNPVQLKLRANALKPTEYVAQVSRVGGLHVVVGSALWGERGKVTPLWKFAQPRRKGYTAKIQPALSPVFTQAQDAMRYAHERMGARDGRQFGVILKNLRDDEYIATEPTTANGNSILLSGLFPIPFGSQAYSLPAGFDYYAVYIAAPKDPVDPVPGSVYADFVAPQDLADSAVLMSTVRDFLPRGSAYPQLYISTREGALLSYRASGRNALLDIEGPFSSQRAMSAGLISGKIRPVEYVRHVAGGGEMQVLLTSNMWATEGRVTTAWRPNAFEIPIAGGSRARELALGPLFSHIDDAALYCHRRLPHPHAQDAVGAILRSSLKHLFVAVEPLTNGQAMNGRDRIFLDALFEQGTSSNRSLPVFPPGFAPWAVCYAHRPQTPIYARHGVSEWMDNVFWPADICYVTKSLPRLGFSLQIAYVSGNDGTLLKYVRRQGKAEDDLCERVEGSDYWENQYVHQRWVETGHETENEYLDKLLQAGELIVVQPSDSWPKISWVTPNWKQDVRSWTAGYGVAATTPWARSQTTDKDEL